MKKSIAIIILALTVVGFPMFGNTTASIQKQETPTTENPQEDWTLTEVQPLRTKDSGWIWSLWNRELLYKNYIADPFAPTMQFFYQIMIESELIMENRFEIRPAFSASLLRFSNEKNPNIGADLFLTITLPFIMASQHFEMISFEGVFAVGVSVTPIEGLGFKLFRHHFSSHTGDEIGDIDQSTIDWDTSTSMQNATYLRDEWALAVAIEPLAFMENSPERLYTRLYGEAYLGFNSSGMFGGMFTRPGIKSPWWFQWGAEAIYTFSNPKHGGFYGALNVSHFQENGFAPNTSIMIGYTLPYAKDVETSVGFSWYRGRSRANNFYYMQETMTGLVLKLNI